MHEYHKLKNKIIEILSGAGYEEDKPDTEIGYCGSLYCIYVFGEKRFMIQWDGEEGFGSVERWQGNNTWEALVPIVPEGSEEEFNRNLCSLSQVVKGLL